MLLTLAGLVFGWGVRFGLGGAAEDAIGPGIQGGAQVLLSLGAAPAPVQFVVPGGTRYHLQYDAARLAVWTTVDREHLIPPLSPIALCEPPGGDVCTTDQCLSGACQNVPNAGLYGDVDHNGIVNIYDAFCVLDGFAGTFDRCTFADVDIEPCTRNGVVNVFDLFAILDVIGGNPACCQALPPSQPLGNAPDAPSHGTLVGASGACQSGTTTVYVEGLTVSQVPDDASMTLRADPTTPFVLESFETKTVTVLQVQTSPTTVSAGTPISITIQPPGAVAFDANTTASLIGQVGPAGGPTFPVAINFSAAEFLETSPSEAIVIAGTGSVDVPLAAFLFSAADLAGTLTLNAGGEAIDSGQAFVVTETDARLYYVDYINADLLPTLGEPADPFYVFPGPVPDEDRMRVLSLYHQLAVVPVDKNATTLAGPATIEAQVVTFPPGLSAIQASVTLTLTRQPDDTDPEVLFYVSDLFKPIFPLNVPVDREQFTEFTPIHTPYSGLLVIVPEGVQP